MSRFRYGREQGDWNRDDRGQGQGRDDWRRRYENDDEDRWSSSGDWRGDSYRMDRDRQDDEYRRFGGSEGRRVDGSRWGWEGDRARYDDRGGYGQEFGGEGRGGQRYGQNYGGYYGGQGYGESGNFGRYREQGHGGQGYGERYGMRGYGMDEYGQRYRGYGMEGRYGNQGYGNQGYGQRYGNQGYGNQGYGNQGYGQSNEGRYGQGRGWGNNDSPWRGQDDDWNSQSSFGRGAYREEGGFGGGYGSMGGMGMQRQGRPPKGYTRSDERIREDVSDRLAERTDASEISVEVKNGEVTLSGTVRDRWTKHQMELIADSIGGVKEVNNQIRVQREGESDRSTMGSTTSRSKSSNDTSANQSSTYSQRS